MGHDGRKQHREYNVEFQRLGWTRVDRRIHHGQRADTHAGQIGADPNAVQYPYSSSLNNNRVDAFYLAPDTWIWDGTPKFEGNNGQVLWEQPEAGGTTNTYNYAGAQYLCNRPASTCSAFN